MTKLIEQDILIDQPLPPSASWDTLSDRPMSLKDISITDATTLDTASTTATSAQGTANQATIDAGNAQTSADGAQTTANGAQSSADSANAGLTDIAIQGWTFDGVFTAVANQQIDWTLGTLRFKDGTSFAITANGVASTSLTYIYFDKAVSTTQFQESGTPTDSVGPNKVLVAVMKAVTDTTKKATFQVFGGGGGIGAYVNGENIAQSSIESTHIVAGTILASNIAANTITGNNIAVNSITGNNIAIASINANKITSSSITATQIATNTITATQMNVNDLSAISANIGTITAGSITGVTITGGTITGGLIQTSAVGKSITIDSTSNQITVNDSAGYAGSIYGSANALVLDTLTLQYNYQGVSYMSFTKGLAQIRATIIPTLGGTFDLGNQYIEWRNIWGENINLNSSSTSPICSITNNGSSNSIYIDHTNAASTYPPLYITNQSLSNSISINQLNTANADPAIYLSNLGAGDGIYVNSGAFLSNGGVWTNASSRTLKENFKNTSTLDKISKIDVLEYNYISENREIRKRSRTKKGGSARRLTNKKLQKHMTPMSEDFYRIFKLGDNRSISPADIAGVALQAIKELNKKVESLQELINTKGVVTKPVR